MGEFRLKTASASVLKAGKGCAHLESSPGEADPSCCYQWDPAAAGLVMTKLMIVGLNVLIWDTLDV